MTEEEITRLKEDVAALSKEVAELERELARIQTQQKSVDYIAQKLADKFGDSLAAWTWA